MTDSIRWPEQ